MAKRVKRVPNTRLGTPNGEPKPYQYWDEYHEEYRWRYQIELTPSMASKRIRVVGSGSTPKEAKNKAHLLKRKRLAKGLDTTKTVDTVTKSNGGITFEQFALAWLEGQKGNIQESTRDGYKAVIYNHLIPALGHYEMWEIDKNAITGLMSVLREKKKPNSNEPLLGYNRQLLIYRQLRKMFVSAVEEHDLLKKSPVIASHQPKKLVEQPLTKRQHIPERMRIANLIVDTAYQAREEDPLTFVWLALMINGLRQGERGGLAWSDISNLNVPNEATLRVNRQLVHEGGGRGNYLKDAVKTEGSYREIPISEKFREGLLLLKKKRRVEKAQPEWQEWGDDPRMSDLVLLTPKGQPFTQGRDNSRWKKHLESWVEYYDPENKNSPLYEKWTGHVWRKICASIYLSQGVNPEITRRIMGHTYEAMTSYYQDLAIEDLRPSVNQVESVLELGERLNDYVDDLVEDMIDRNVEQGLEDMYLPF